MTNETAVSEEAKTQTDALRKATKQADVAAESLAKAKNYEPAVVISLLECVLGEHPDWDAPENWAGSKDEQQYDGSGLARRIAEPLIASVPEFSKLKADRIAFVYLKRDNWMKNGVMVRATSSRNNAAVSFLTKKSHVLTVNFDLFHQLTGLQKVHAIYRALAEIAGKPDYSVFWHELRSFGAGVFRETLPLEEALAEGQVAAMNYQHELELVTDPPVPADEDEELPS